MRLIDADKLTDGKGVFNKAIHADFERVGGAYIMIKDLLSILDNQPTIGEWIPVEERLPKWGERALTCDAKGNQRCCLGKAELCMHSGIYAQPPKFFTSACI